MITAQHTERVNLQLLEFPFLQRGLIRLQVLNKKKEGYWTTFPWENSFFSYKNIFFFCLTFPKTKLKYSSTKKPQIHPVSPQPLAVSHGLPGLIAGRYSPEPLNKLFNNMSPRIDSLFFFSLNCLLLFVHLDFFACSVSWHLRLCALCPNLASLPHCLHASCKSRELYSEIYFQPLHNIHFHFLCWRGKKEEEHNMFFLYSPHQPQSSTLKPLSHSTDV